MKTLAPGPVPGELFDERPLEIAGFSFKAHGVTPVGKPSAQQWQQAFQFAEACGKAAGFWIGDLLRYAETRREWREVLDQLKAHTKLSEKTLRNQEIIAAKVDEHERAIAPSHAHAAEVAALPRHDQARYLARAREEGWTRGELRMHIKADRRRRVIEGQALLKGQYRVIYADPPWAYRQNRPTESGEMRRAEEAYPTMSVEDLCKLPVAAHATEDAVLALWATAPLLLQNPGPREVIEAWGFTYKTNYVWDKVVGMPGSYSYVCHEHLIIATRGSGTPDIPISQHDHDSVITAKRDGEHSEKPQVVRKMLEQLYPAGKRLELFGRQKHPGWTVYGNDARLWK